MQIQCEIHTNLGSGVAVNQELWERYHHGECGSVSL